MIYFSRMNLALFKVNIWNCLATKMSSSFSGIDFKALVCGHNLMKNIQFERENYIVIWNNNQLFSLEVGGTKKFPSELTFFQKSKRTY